MSLAPTWFDPAETPGIITPVHGALRAARRDGEADAGHSRWRRASPNRGRRPRTGCTYDFVLREGVEFHNGEPVTAEDVKFSFERYRGASHDADEGRGSPRSRPPIARHVRFKLKEPWPDFLTFYASATGAGWIVPKKYVEKVGDDGFKKAPIGAGPYKFVSFTPGRRTGARGLRAVLAQDAERQAPGASRSIPEETTRLAALKRGEVDIVYSIRGELAEELRRTPGLTLKPVDPPGAVLALFPRPVGPEIAVA